VKCWGDNAYGQIGSNEPGSKGYMDWQTTMGTNLEYLPFDNVFGDNLYPIQYFGGGLGNVCARMQTGDIKCWGRQNAYGVLGYGDTAWHEVAVFGAPREGGESKGTLLPFVNVGGNYVISMTSYSYQNRCALLDNAKVTCWGLNDQGQLGIGSTVDKYEPGVYVDIGDQTVKKISIDSYAVVALLRDGTVKTWGMAWNGGLGYGDDVVRGADPATMGNNLPTLAFGEKVVDVARWYSGGCALMDTGLVKCWGVSYKGALASDPRSDRTD
ncbi:regulator of chromosome condensation 1/beta-lactamase-inhibitor protein II, partial [Baffinella frigidus]